MTNASEMVVQKRITRAWMRAGSVSISLVRPGEWITTAAGGRVQGDPITLPPQDFRIVPFKRRLSQIKSINQEGDLTISTYALVGYDDADVQPKDEFTLAGCRYIVDSVEPTSPEFSFRTLAVLTFYGTPDPGMT